MKKQKKPAQNNHEGCYIPGGMEMYADQPIYIIVALWCLHRNTWVNRNDIARAFRLSERKASFQLSYLIKNHTSSIVMYVKSGANIVPRPVMRSVLTVSACRL
ncbi:CaiF/GrlA family transcriptional regulator [Salmonella enterica]|nr:CaiF/GrlA family transcriptional regulator [Salmonella enterica subsp. enterica serovar Infantis]EGH9605235.1 CaiF/GrlA family transcriptional regulator [Salmonella enterica]QVP48040.1 CaiF/GrlA family transcriptional regulator [Salmonella enterica subsp. salamae]